MEDFLRDLKQSLRGLRHSPATRIDPIEALRYE